MALSPAVEERVRVAVRVRPCSGCATASKSPLEVSESRIVRTKAKDHQFDRVFGPGASNAEVYEYFSGIVSGVTTGVHTTIFAYGPTGSGKTHTMLGHGLEDSLKQSCGDADAADDGFEALEVKGDGLGIIPRAVADLFRRLEGESASASAPQRYAVHMAYIQIYNERIYDCLADPRREHALHIRESAGGAVYVQGLTEVRCGTAEEILTLLVAGGRHRARRETALNKQSSRSHAIVTLSVQIETAAERTVLKRALLNLVDLAGSEKWGDRYDMDDTETKELLSINTSLSALGNCIKALQEKGRQHVPFRDSTLTRLLQDSLAGGGRTAVLACISEDAASLEDSISTLQFASRASCVTCKVRTNEVVSDTILLKRALREIERLRKKLGVVEGESVSEDDPSRMAEKELRKRPFFMEGNLEAERAKNCVLEKKIEELMVHVPEDSLVFNEKMAQASSRPFQAQGETGSNWSEGLNQIDGEGLEGDPGRQSDAALEQMLRRRAEDMIEKAEIEEMDDIEAGAPQPVEEDQRFPNEFPETDVSVVPGSQINDVMALVEAAPASTKALSAADNKGTADQMFAADEVCAAHGLRRCCLCPPQPLQDMKRSRVSHGRCTRHNLDKCVLCANLTRPAVPDKETEDSSLEPPLAPCSRHHLRKCFLCSVSKNLYSSLSPSVLEAPRWKEASALSVASSIINSPPVQSKSLQSIQSAFSFGSPSPSAFTPNLERPVDVDFEALARQSKEYVSKNKTIETVSEEVRPRPMQRKAKTKPKVRTPCVRTTFTSYLQTSQELKELQVHRRRKRRVGRLRKERGAKAPGHGGVGLVAVEKWRKRRGLDDL